MMKRKTWTRDEDLLISREYPAALTGDLAKKLGCSISQLYDRAHALKLKKDPSYLAKHGGRLDGIIGKDCRFKKGQAAWNKGVKGLCFSPATTFKKGHIPQTHREVGSVQYRSDGYTFIKIAEPNKWIQLHRLVWECEMGPVPDGKLVKFRDGNHENCDISNLYLADRREHMMHNSIVRFTPELRSTIHTLAKLKNYIKQYGTQQN